MNYDLVAEFCAKYFLDFATSNFVNCDLVHWILSIVYLDLLGLLGMSTRFYAKCTWILCITYVGFYTLTILAGFCAVCSWILCTRIWAR